MTRSDRIVHDALVATGLPYTIEPGARHRKIKVAGRLAGILPRSPTKDSDLRPALNVASQIKRLAREINQ